MQVYNPNDPQFHKKDDVSDANMSGINFEMGNGFEAGEDSLHTAQFFVSQSRYAQEEKSSYPDLKTRKSSFGIKHYLTCFLCIACCVIFFGKGTMSDVYLEKGIPVTAKVTHVDLGFRGSYRVYGTCNVSDKVTVKVEIINVSKHTPIGTVVKGYYLPENPTRVWCKPNTSDQWLVNVLVGLIGLAGVIGLIRAFKWR